MKYTSQDIILAFATGLGAFGGFPKPPRVFNNLLETYPIFRWLLVFILVWQGGAKQDHKLATLITATIFALSKALE
jgi:hypothetical protein